MSSTADAVAGTPAGRPKVHWATKFGVDRYSALYLWGLFMLVFGLTLEQYFTRTSIELVFTEKVVIGFLAFAFLIPLACETFDLSIGANMSLALVLVNDLSRSNGNPQLVNALLALLACAAVGFVSGFIVVKLGVNSFIATLGMSQVVSALIVQRSDNRQINDVLTDGFRDIGRKNILSFPLYFWYMLILAVILWFILEHTPLGRYLFAVGGNKEAARLAGIRTDRYIWGSLLASAVVAGLAGIMYAFKSGTFSQTVGPGLLFPAVAAVFFGASQIKGRPNVWGTLIAVYALAFGVKGLQLQWTNATAWLEPLFEGISLLVAVAIASYRGVIRVKRRKVNTAAS